VDRQTDKFKIATNCSPSAIIFTGRKRMVYRMSRNFVISINGLTKEKNIPGS
jgi:hypothetical protein